MVGRIKCGKLICFPARKPRKYSSKDRGIADLIDSILPNTPVKSHRYSNFIPLKICQSLEENS